MDQLAQGGQYAASSGAERAHHAIRIPVAVVRQGDDAAERVLSGRAVTESLETNEKGANYFRQVLDVC
jgi:hypothetical protein